MIKIEDLTGKKFGKLTVIERDYNKIRGKTEYYKCNCDCGTKDFITTAKELLAGKASCGCNQRFKSFNKYKIVDDYVIIYFKRKKDGIELEGYIDLKYLPIFLEKDLPYSAVWMPNIQDYYAKATEYLGTINGKSKYKIHHMHLDIMGNIPGMKVDHIEHKLHSSLDNRKRNLRVVESSKNSSNRKGANKNSGTGVRNVNYGTDRKEYWVQFCKEGERFKWIFPLNQFNEACKFAEEKRKEIFGEFAGKS